MPQYEIPDAEGNPDLDYTKIRVEGDVLVNFVGFGSPGKGGCFCFRFKRFEKKNVYFLIRLQSCCSDGNGNHLRLP